MANKPTKKAAVAPGSDIATILDNYKMAVASLVATQKELEDMQTHIARRAAAARRAPTKDEISEMDALYNKESAIDDTIRALAWTKLQAMSESDQLQQIADGLKDLKAGLDKTLDELKNLAKIADTAAQAADFLGKVVQGLISMGLWAAA